MWRRWRYGKKPDNRLIITIYAIDSKRFIISLERLAVKAAAVADASRAEGIHPFIAFIGKNLVTHGYDPGRTIQVSTERLMMQVTTSPDT